MPGSRPPWEPVWRPTEAPIAGHDCPEMLADGQGGGEMNSVEAAEGRGLEGCGGRQDLAVDFPEVDPGEDVRARRRSFTSRLVPALTPLR